MRKLFYAVIAYTLLLTACGRRSIPSKSVAEPSKPKVAPDRVEQDQYVKRAVILDSIKNAAAAAEKSRIADSIATADSLAKVNAITSALVVIDSRGVLQIQDASTLPLDVSHNLDSLSRSVRAYTPNEAKNLAFRFKEIPPRVLYVPENLVKKGVKGYYYKYNNKFWYWRKQDGYFYLDENYYK